MSPVLRRASIVALITCLALSATGSAQGVPINPEVRRTIGSATIRGRVVAADTGKPLLAAQVAMRSSELRETRYALTDADGRFEIRELPASMFTVTASQDGFISLGYLQSRTTQTARTLMLGDREVVENVNFSLPRGGVISGAVYDDAGDPMSNVVVRVSRFEYRRQRALTSVSSGPTNDIGEFRIAGLPAGSYYVSVAMGARRPGSFENSGPGFEPTFSPERPSSQKHAA